MPPGFNYVSVVINYSSAAVTLPRQSYVKSVLDGETVFDTNDGAAKGEIDVLAAEIIKIVA